MERAFLGIGDFELHGDFAHHRLTMDKWRIMTKEQQTAYLKEMKTWPVKRLLRASTPSQIIVGSSHESNITSMVQDTDKIISTMNGVVPYPGDVTVAKKLDLLQQVIKLWETSNESGSIIPDPCTLLQQTLAPNAGKKEREKRKGKNRHTERTNIPLLNSQNLDAATSSEGQLTTWVYVLIKKDEEAALALLTLHTQMQPETPPNEASTSKTKSGKKTRLGIQIPFTLTPLKEVQGYSCYACCNHIRAYPNIPQAPFDYCIVNFEKREWQKTGGPQCILPKCVSSYYHFDADCIKRKHAAFEGKDLYISPQVAGNLPPCHEEHLRQKFGLVRA
eukprot:gene20861-22913_t